MKIDRNIIKELTDYLNEFNLTEIEYADKDTKIKVSKSISSNSTQFVSTASSDMEANKPQTKSTNGTEVTSPIIELHISNIYKREEFRRKSLISDVATGGIFGLGDNGYILAIIAMQNMLKK